MAHKKSKTTNKPKNVAVTTVTETKPEDSPNTNKIHPSNKELIDRKFLFPMLSVDVVKKGIKYPDQQRIAQESEFKDFKAKTDFSIPIVKTITKVIRIRTLMNKEQALGEYIYYYANLQGFQKHLINGETQIYPSAEASDVPFGADKHILLVPTYKNGVQDGWEDKGENDYFTEKFTKDSIDNILENTESGRVEYIVKDTGVTYGGFTKDELSKCKLNRLIFRNSNKLNGTEILQEDLLK